MIARLRQLGALVGLWGGLVVAPPASAAPDDVAKAVLDCLDRQDVGCAQAIVEREGLVDGGPGARALAGRVAFFAGDYPTAVALTESAVEEGITELEPELRTYRNTLHATAGWVEQAVGRYRVRYRPGLEALLAEEAGEVLQITDDKVVPMLGSVPPGNTIVELYPDGERFVAASSLTRADVEATSVVAISKWSRLLVCSPRAIGRGYPWKDTLSHEYIHLVVAHNSADRAPVWLQEGIAKALDHRWRDEPYTLSPQSTSLLARALADDALVPFEEMHPSLAKIKVLDASGNIDRQRSAQRAQLAYAQLATLVDFVMDQKGDDVLVGVLADLAAGTDAFDALAQASGRGTFAALLADWRRWLKGKGLKDRGIEVAPMVLDGGSDQEADPVMATRRDLFNKLRLGDLLASRGRYRAALVEYEQAADADSPNSPMRAARMAEAWIGLDEDEEAKRILRASVADYPDSPSTRRLLGRLARAQGQMPEAVSHFETVVGLAPFGLEDHQALRALYAELGDTEGVARQEQRLQILRLGGAAQMPPVVHERYGTIDVPEGRKAVRDPSLGSPLIGQPAPSFRATDLQGEPFLLGYFRTQVVVLDFWATWCGPCRAVMPALSDLAARHPEDLVVFGLSDETRDTVERFVAQQQRRGRSYAYPFGLDDGSAREAFGVSSIPTLVVIDRRGRVHDVHVGAQDIDGVIADIEALIAGEGAGSGPQDVDERIDEAAAADDELE